MFECDPADRKSAEAARGENHNDAEPGRCQQHQSHERGGEQQPKPARAFARRARICPQSVRTGRLQPTHGRGEQGPAPGGRGDQGSGGSTNTDMGEGGKRGDLDDQHQGHGDDPVRADPAVAHDAEFGGLVGPAPEPVGDIGQAVFMQRAGQQDHGGNRQRCSDTRRNPGPGKQPQGDRPGATDGKADQGEKPHGLGESRRGALGEIIFGGIQIHRQTREERDCEAHLREEGVLPGFRVCIHGRVIGQRPSFGNEMCGIIR